MQRRSGKTVLFFVLILFALFLLFPDRVQSAAAEGVAFCAAVIIPSLFPGFVLTDLILSLSDGTGERGILFSKLFRLPSSAFRCWLIGLLAGFPAAADCAVRLVSQNRLTKTQGERCLAFTNNPGIVFVIGTVGAGLFHSLSAGVYLWIIQTVSGLLVGILFAVPGEDRSETEGASQLDPPSFFHAFPKAITASVTAVLNVCGFILFFRVLIFLAAGREFLGFGKAVLAGLLELTSGIARLGSFSLTSAVVASFLLGWSGFCVHFQILNALFPASLSPRYYFPGKALQALFSAGLTAVTYPVLFSATGSVSFLSVLAFLCFILMIIFIRVRRECLHGTEDLRIRKKPPEIYHRLH